MTRRNKYNAREVKLDGYTFDSLAESRRYSELKLLQKAGKIGGLIVHAPVFLHAINRANGKASTIGQYEVDFHYFELPSQTMVFEDVKGVMTPLARWKIKHVDAEYGIKVRIIRGGRKR